MKKSFLSVRSHLDTATKIIVLIFALAITTIAATAIVYFNAASELVLENEQTVVLNACIGNADAAEDVFRTRMTAIADAAKDFSKADIGNEKEIAELCKKLCGSTPFRHIGFTDKSGATVNQDGKLSNTTHRAFIIDGLEGRPSLTTNTFCDFSDNNADMYTVPVTAEDGSVIGVLTGETEPFTIAEIDPLDIAGNTNCYYILDENGKTVYSSANNTLGISNGESLTARISDNSETTGGDIEYLLNSKFDASVKSISIDDTVYTAAFVPISSRDWAFAAVVQNDTVQRSFSGTITVLMVFAMLMVLVILSLMILFIINIRKMRTEVTDLIEESFRNATTDSITGHDSWDTFIERYNVTMKSTSSGYAMLSLDINGFKAVNDKFGYDGGNELLRKISAVIKRRMGTVDFFARSNADQFYIMKDFQRKDELTTLADNLASDIEYLNSDIKLTASIGIYIITDHKLKVRTAADRADLARKTAKNNQKSRSSFFDAKMIEKIRREKYIESIMEDALELGEFLVYLQPKFDLTHDSEVVGAEALVRWKHDGKLIPPGDFIPLFERNGFVVKIDFYMFEQVCILQKKWLDMGFEPKVISVNMSRVHLSSASFVDDLAQISRKYEIDTKYIEIEITESAAYENLDVLVNVFRQIKNYGFHVSIDDFGTGYSSLNMLKDLPVDVLKIDRSFLTENADENENASRIIESVVSLAASLCIRTICEGIETSEQASLLRKLGCNMAQGFYYARPMTVPDYEKLTYGIEEKQGSEQDGK